MPSRKQMGHVQWQHDPRAEVRRVGFRGGVVCLLTAIQAKSRFFAVEGVGLVGASVTG